MLYDVTLRIAYNYDSPATGGRHLLRMIPADVPGQRLIAAGLEISPRPSERLERKDFFNNRVTELAFDAPLAKVAFTLRARIERQAQAARLDASPSLPRLAAELAAQPQLTAASPHHFLPPSPRLGAAPKAIAAFAAEAAADAASAGEAVAAVSRALHGHMTFEAGATHVGTTFEEAFEGRRGVCQDYTHIMIAMLRSLGIPAGYVSGFLRTEPPEGQPRLEGADAMHAWVRAWCGAATGWVEIDPTNDMAVGGDHLTVAIGRDYSDVAPVRGAIRLSGAHGSSQAVDVIPVE
ncbi:transglutaminase family protein [Pseudoroseicyclus tamaricis]|uniref:Transglutaminase family protein n=1 Tax=Pseudoroseicyclus tamaricis TaxID=2705421 RepID=A0A6B2JZA3_9RHOB|nr:transglutaminase family protein [Pseudoroseicyclus tamaricis]NDV00702.1 transglutaminase family protein [Pseudoroseicyclus tamaricis]